MNKKIQKYLEEILRLLKIRIPTEYNHSIGLITDEDWNLENQLCIWIYLVEKNNFQSILFDEKDEDETPEVLVQLIIDDLIKYGYDKSFFN